VNRRSFVSSALALTALSALAGCASPAASATNSTTLPTPAPGGASAPLAAIRVSLAPTAVPPTPTPIPPSPTPGPVAPVQSGNKTAPTVTATAIAVVDGASGEVLFGKDAHGTYAPASLTKIFTALVALRHGRLDQEITVQYDVAQLPDSTMMGIKPGERYTLQDLLYGLLLPSGGDAALAIANAVGGTVPNFVSMMNAEATGLGLHDSNFVNPHGLDAPNLHSSAYDMAMAGRFGMATYPIFRKIVGTKAWDVHGTRSFEIYNLNKFLWNYSGADGVKIGYTDLAGRTIVASAVEQNHQVFVSLMRLGDWVSDTVPLFNWAFENFTWSSNR